MYPAYALALSYSRSVTLRQPNVVVLCTIIACNSCTVIKLLHNYFSRAKRCNNCRHSNMLECLQLLQRVACKNSMHE